MNPSIAIIDSGVNPGHRHVGRISGGLGFRMNQTGTVVMDADFRDEIGHGTAIWGIIRDKAPFADLVAVKLFQTELSASVSTLMAALEWAVDQRFRIIHLSLGVDSRAASGDLEILCRKAEKHNCLILASARGPRDRVYPACLPSVLGVYWNRSLNSDQIVFHPGSIIEFGAHGQPRPLPGLPQEQNLKGNSFAVAYVTARAAGLARQYPDRDNAWIREELIRSATCIPDEESCRPPAAQTTLTHS